MRSPFSPQNHQHQPSTKESYALEVQDMSIKYRDVEALCVHSLQFRTGSLHGIAGPNGAGKSSFVRGTLALTKRASGFVMINGHAFYKPQHAADYQVSYVPQRANIILSFPISVFDIVTSGLHRPKPRIFLSKKEKQAQKEKTWAMLNQFGLTTLAQRQIGELSGGQQQKVFFARAMIARPKVLFLDEPFNGIDMPTTTYLFEILKTEAKENQTTIITVHHDLNTLHQFDTVTFINKVVLVSGTPEHVLTPSWIKRAYA